MCHLVIVLTTKECTNDLGYHSLEVLARCVHYWGAFLAASVSGLVLHMNGDSNTTFGKAVGGLHLALSTPMTSNDIFRSNETQISEVAG